MFDDSGVVNKIIWAHTKTKAIILGVFSQDSIAIGMKSFSKFRLLVLAQMVAIMGT